MASEAQPKGPVPITPDAIESVQFRVFNRLVATKPLREVLGLIEISEEATQRRLFTTEEDSLGDGDDESAGESEGDGYLHIASAFQPDVFGIRIGVRWETSDHVFVLDTAVEYTLSSQILYTDKEFEQFVKSEAAPRAAVSTWTALEELVRSIDATPGSLNLAIPTPMVADAVLTQQRRDAESD